MADRQGAAGRGRPHVASGGVWLRRLTLYTVALLAGPAGLLVGVKTGLLEPPRREPPQGTFRGAPAPPTPAPATTAPPTPTPAPRPTATPFADELGPAASPSPEPATRRRALKDGKVFEAEDAPQMLEGLFLLRRPGESLRRLDFADWEGGERFALPSGTEFRFRFRFDAPVYLYLFNVQPLEEKTDVLFPHPQLEARNPLPAEAGIELPDTDPAVFYRLDPLGPGRQRSVEGLMLVYARRPLPRLEALAGEIARRGENGAALSRQLLKRFAEEAERPAPGKAAWRFTLLHVESAEDSP